MVESLEMQAPCDGKWREQQLSLDSGTWKPFPGALIFGVIQSMPACRGYGLCTCVCKGFWISLVRPSLRGDGTRAGLINFEGESGIEKS